MALISSVFSRFFCKHEKPAARPHPRARNEKPGAACRPGSWRSFGEYAFLEDSRYTSQAENRAAIKSINQHRKSVLPVGAISAVHCANRPQSSLNDGLRKQGLRLLGSGT